MKPATSACKQIAVSAFLALALLGVQSAAMLHWLAHSIDAARSVATRGVAVGAHRTGAEALGDAASRGKPDAGGFAVADHCDACLAFSALGTGAAAADLVVAAKPSATPIAIADDVAAQPTTFRLAFRSRAPPVLI